MKQKLFWLLLVLAGAAQAAPGAATAPQELKPVPQEARAAHVAAEVLTRYHYTGTPLDAALSNRIFDQYLKMLDAEKLLFVQADIDKLSAHRAGLGEAIVKEDLSVPFAMFNLYRQRVAERFTYARGLLAKGFDFRKPEGYQFARDKAGWAKSEDEVLDLWRKRVKNDWLRLKIAGKNDKQIVELLDRRYDTFIKRITRVRSTDAFQTFMNAYTTAIEPHTNYLGPRAAAEFDISMRLSLVGIGASLAELDDYVTIRELIPGGPAILSGLLNPGDRIVGVAQGQGAAMTEILGWRLDDAVALIRGAPDSVVVLDILPADAGPNAKHKLISLVRKKISLEAQAAKATIHEVTDGQATRRVGVISLPSFYEDFAGRQNGTKDFRSATRDVVRLLEDLKSRKVDSLLIDLRNNGGGSLSQAIELTGLFIDKGPVVQQRNARGQISVGSDNLAGVAWDGPLGVLINRRSASASEIFAAAIQDYGRGLIIGEASFGKGTVQNLVDLDRIAKNAKPQFGELKMTIAQFFRINGGTTQLRGVQPDIAFPEVSDVERVGESSFDNALPWVQIKALDYAPAGDMKSVQPVLLARHEARVRADKDFRVLQESIADAKAQRDKNLVSLNEVTRRKEQAALEARQAAREAAMDAGKAAGKGASGADNPLRDDGLQFGERNLAKELATEKARKAVKDVLLNEAVRILADAAAILPASPGLAGIVKPGASLLPN